MSIGRSFGRLPDLMADDYEVKDIELVDLKSRKTAPLPDSKGLFAPRWSPDGRYIAAMQLNQSRLMLFDTIRKNLAYAVTARDSQSDLVQRFAVDLLPGIHGAGAAHLSRRARKRARRANLTVFRHEQDLNNTDRTPILPSLGWERYSTKPVTVIPIPGRHGTILSIPYVRDLASSLDEVIIQALTSQKAITRNH